MRLESHEITSALWIKLSGHYKAKLQEYRERNDGNLSAEGTLRLRGRITEVKELLDMADEQIKHDGMNAVALLENFAQE